MKTLKFVEEGFENPGVFIVSKQDNYVKIESCVFPSNFCWKLNKTQTKRLRNWLTVFVAK